jgi:hypothetical protein
MRNMLLVSMLLFGASATCGAAGEAAWDAHRFSSWTDKYPTTTVNNKRVSVLDDKAIKAVLEQTIPAREKKLLDTLHTESPIKMMGDFVLINKCKPRNCPSELAMIVIDIHKKRVWAGFFSREAGRVSTRWYGNEDNYSVLPMEIKQEFLTRHGD